LETLKEEAESKMLWEMTWKDDDVSEDNDTEEEDSEEEDALEGEEYLKHLNQKKQEGRINELINPKKGFKFFIEQEQKLLDSLERKQQAHLKELKEKQKQVHDQHGQLSIDNKPIQPIEELKVEEPKVVELLTTDKKTLRLVCISDTHNQHRKIKVPDGDVLIHAGDITSKGQKE
jgi:hypothetical protein